jgi:hypothetical protein
MKRAQCIDLDSKFKNICAKNDYFFPYMLWKNNNNDMGMCWIGTEENDYRQFLDDGNNVANVYLTPQIGKIEELDELENKSKIDLIKRLQKKLEESMKKILKESIENNFSRDYKINENDEKIDKLDKDVMTITQKIKQNNNKYDINKNVSNLLDISVKIIVIFLIIIIIYFAISKTNIIKNL